MSEGQQYTRVAEDPNHDPHDGSGSLPSSYRSDPETDPNANGIFHWVNIATSIFAIGCLLKIEFFTPEPVQRFSSNPPEITNSLRGENAQCLSISSLRTLIDITDQVFVTMPARGAGTSFKEFGDQCFGSASYPLDIGNKGQEAFEDILTKEYVIPKLITSHNGKNLTQTLHNMPASTLVVYAHRKETPRMLSAIKHVVITRYCNEKSTESALVEKMEGDDCYVSEGELINLVKTQQFEIGEGASSALSCELYEVIDSASPTMVFMDYSNTDEMQNLLAEKYCPDLAGKPVHSPEESSKVYVHMDKTVTESGESIVSLDAWLETKSAIMEFSLALHDKATCVGKTRNMEDGLTSCKDGYLSSKAFLN